jgi:hypothetical protein
MKKKLYYQKKATEGLKGGPNYVKRTTSGFIESDYGQWEFPGEPTLINSNSITMKGVPYPVFGMDDLGNSQMMYPEQDYLYPGNKVYEIPMAQKGYNVKPRVGSITLKGQTEPSTHYMMREYGPTGWVAFPSIFQNPDNSWVNMSDEKDWMKIYKEAQKRGEVYNFGEDEEAAINFADKGSWKKELGIKKNGGWLDNIPKAQRGTIYVDNPNDPRLQDYNDSLSLYNKYKKDLATRGSESVERRFNINDPLISDLLPLYGIDKNKIKPTRIDQYTSGYNGAGTAFVPVYKKPVQPVVYRNPEIRAKQEELVNAGFNIGEVDGIWGKKSQAAWEEYQKNKNSVKKEEPKKEIITVKNQKPKPINHISKDWTQGIGDTYTIYYGDPTNKNTKTQTLSPKEYDILKQSESYKQFINKKKTGGWLDRAQKGRIQVSPYGYIGGYPTWSGDTGIEGDFGANVDFGNINFDLANRFNIESDPELSQYISPSISANIPFNKGRGNVNFSAGSYYNQPNITTGVSYRFGKGGWLDTYQDRGEVKPKFQYSKNKDLGTFLKEATKPKPSMYEFNNKGLSKQEALEANRAQDATRVAGFRQNLPDIDLGPKLDPSGQYMAEILSSPINAARDIYNNPTKYGKTFLNLVAGAYGATPILDEADVERSLNMAEVTPMLGGIGSLTKKPLSNAVNALRYRDLSSEELKNFFKELTTKLKNNLDNKLITPLQFRKEIKDLKEYSNKSAEFWKTPEGRRRLEDIGITPDKMIPYNLTFRSGEKTKYFSPTATVNIDFRELNNLKKQRGLDLTPRTALEHETGHHLQREYYRMNEYLKDIKKFQDELAEWKQRQIEAKKTTNPFKRNIYNWLYDPEPTGPTLLSKPTKIDEALKTLEAKPEAIQQLANIEGSSRTMTNTPELTRAAESLDYWHHLEKGDVERLPHLRELRQNMMNKGIIKNLEDRITKDMVIDYFNSTKGDRIGSFIKKSPINLRFLTEQLNNAPALIPAIGLTGLGAAGYNQLNNNTMYKKGGWLDNLPKAQVGEEVPTIGPIDLPAIEISDKADPRALINQGAFFGKEPNKFIKEFRNRLPQLFYTEQGTSGYGPMNQGSINLPSTDISAPFVDPNTGEVDYTKMALTGAEGILSSFAGQPQFTRGKGKPTYVNPKKLEYRDASGRLVYKADPEDYQNFTQRKYYDEAIKDVKDYARKWKKEQLTNKKNLVNEAKSLATKEPLLTEKDFYTNAEINQLIKNNKEYLKRIDAIYDKYGKIDPNKTPNDINEIYPNLKKEWEDIMKINHSFRDKELTPEQARKINKLFKPADTGLDISKRSRLSDYAAGNERRYSAKLFNFLQSIGRDPSYSDRWVNERPAIILPFQNTGKAINVPLGFTTGQMNKYGGQKRGWLDNLNN